MRLGPSASEIHEHKLDALVKSLSHIQSVLEDPAMREVIGNVAPQLLDLNKNQELAEAEAGKPSGSRPGKRSTEMAPPAAPPTKSPKTVANQNEMSKAAHGEPAPTSPVTTPATVPDETSTGETEINSSTHRAAHARLVRRMEKLPVADFHNMTRLWNGSRKETRYLFESFSLFLDKSPRL